MTDAEASLIIQKIDNIETLEICLKDVKRKLDDINLQKDKLSLNSESIALNAQKSKSNCNVDSTERRLILIINRGQKLKREYDYYIKERNRAIQLRNNLLDFEYEWDFEREFVRARFIKRWNKAKLMLEFNEKNPSLRLIEIIKKTNLTII